MPFPNVRPGLAPAELAKIEATLDYLKWQVTVYEQKLLWAKKGFFGLSTEAGEGGGGRRNSAIRDQVQGLLADGRPHAKAEIIAHVRQQLGEHVRIPAILSALRSHKIKKQSDKYLLVERIQQRA